MAKIEHDISNPNDGNGDALRLAFDNQNTMNTELYNTKVDKVLGKGLSQNDFTNDLKDKLDDIDLDAQINVQPDWFQEDTEADDYIKNKPDYLNSVGSFTYADLATQTTPLSVVSGVDKRVVNDTLGADTNVSNAPYGVGGLWNATTNEFDFSQLSVGDLVTFELDAYFTTTANDQTYAYYINFATGSGNESIKYLNDAHKKPIGQLKFGGQVLFTIENEDMRDFPAELWILSNHNGSLKVNSFYFSVLRKNINIVDIVLPKKSFNIFEFVGKGFGNTDLTDNEVGDIFRGWSNDGTIRYTEALWLGGDLDDSDNFTPLVQTGI